jgi:diacylglycerol kinase family enzyme
MTFLLVPVGTCNDFARKVYTGTWENALKRIDVGDALSHAYDVGVLETEGSNRVFINNAGFGRTPQRPGARRSSPLTDIANFTEKNLSILIDRNPVPKNILAFFGIFFNAPYFNNAMHFDKTIAPDDGALTLCVVPPQAPKKLMWRFLKSKFGGSLRDAATVMLSGKEFSVVSDQDLFPQVDGEPATDSGVRSLKVRLLPHKVRLEQ